MRDRVRAARSPRSQSSGILGTRARVGLLAFFDRLAARLRAGRSALAAVIAGGIVVVAVLRITQSYGILSGTFDEPAHVAAGMQWLDQGRFDYEPFTPPLARVAVALGPYLIGLRSHGSETIWREGKRILYSDGEYRRNLALARLGVLPFFLVTVLVVWCWARRVGGAHTAAAGVGLCATLPPLLAHSGFATTDMAATAMSTLALYQFSCWLDKRALWRSAALGIAVGLCVLAKFSLLLFLPAGGLAILSLRWRRRFSAQPVLPAVRIPVSLGIAAGLAALVVWAGYRFSFGPALGTLPVPAPELWRGLADARQLKAIGHEAYLFGDISNSGWWYFFPVALAVKTPLPFFVLALLGVWSAIRQQTARRFLEPAVAAAAILAASLFTNMNSGLRYVLPIYPLAAVVAGFGVTVMWTAVPRRWVMRTAVVALLLWQVGSTWRAHPDYLPWFNVLAGREPERILVNGDLDWGQDLLRLADTVRARGIDSLTLAYFGSADPREHFARVRPMAPFERPSGWFAVSVAVIKGLHVPDHTGFEWLEAVEPEAQVGMSIRLYHLKEANRPPQ